MTEEGQNYSQNNIVHRNSDEEIKQLMKKFSASEQDVQVAIQLVGDHREKVERYLENKIRPGLNNIW